MEPLNDTDSWDTSSPDSLPGEEPQWTPARVEIDAAGFSHQGCVRANNEDQFLITRFGRFLESMQSSLPAEDLPKRHEVTGHALLVADGLGGHAAGEVASKTALRILFNLVADTPDWVMRADEEWSSAEVERRAEQRLSQISETMTQKADQEPELRGFGTTLTAAWGLGEQWFVAHVGDSRAYLLRQGALKQLTRDHTVAQQLADTGLIDADRVARHPLRNRLTRLLGDGVQFSCPQMRSLLVEDRDTLLLCSDGLTDMLDDDTIAEILAAEPTAASASRRLIDAALEAGGRDNVTAIVARFQVNQEQGGLTQ